MPDPPLPPKPPKTGIESRAITLPADPAEWGPTLDAIANAEGFTLQQLLPTAEGTIAYLYRSVTLGPKTLQPSERAELLALGRKLLVLAPRGASTAMLQEPERAAVVARVTEILRLA